MTQHGTFRANFFQILFQVYYCNWDRSQSARGCKRVTKKKKDTNYEFRIAKFEVFPNCN